MRRTIGVQGGLVDLVGPPHASASPYNRRLAGSLWWSGHLQRRLSPANYISSGALQQDIEDILPSVQAPTRVLCNPLSPRTRGGSAPHRGPHSNTTFHQLPPDTAWFVDRESLAADRGLSWRRLPPERPHPVDADRYLGTVLFTDVASSTELLERVGDAQYRQMRTDHERLVRLAVENSGGRLMTVTGDGTLSVFDSPTKAVRCAETICRKPNTPGSKYVPASTPASLSTPR